MKKTGLLVCAFLMVAGLANAQLSIGLKGGLNFASLDASKSVGANYEAHTGYNFGAFALFKFTKIGIQPEILFSQQGSKVTYPTSTNNFTSTFQYVNIPIIFKLYTIAGINLQAGPQFGFLTNDPIVKDPSGNTIQDAYKKSDISLGLGAGWDLPFGLSIDARYNLGLSEINSSSNPDVTKNQVIQISVGYKLFKFGK